MIVILDNGHGKNTPGKCSPIWPDGSQLFEYEFNRDIVNRIKLGLDIVKIKSIILVPELNDISLYDRVNRANEYHKVNNFNTILISIHANAGGGTGWEIFTSPGQTESDYLAQQIFASAHNNFKEIKFRRDNSDGDDDKEENFYILRKTKAPAVLSENFFMDNEKDCRYIMSDEGRNFIAKVHVSGIINYINSKK